MECATGVLQDMLPLYSTLECRARQPWLTWPAMLVCVCCRSWHLYLRIVLLWWCWLARKYKSKVACKCTVRPTVDWMYALHLTACHFLASVLFVFELNAILENLQLSGMPDLPPFHSYLPMFLVAFNHGKRDGIAKFSRPHSERALQLDTSNVIFKSGLV